MTRRYARRDAIQAMDPGTQSEQIVRLVATYEFPWDVQQALSFALFRTYAVPSIGGLLARTAELTDHTQKRHDDTVLILDAVLTHGLGSEEGRTAVRRMNHMHRAYGIPNEDMRYVLATFVVTPVRWITAYGWRGLTDIELEAHVTYYRALGRHLGIRDVPETYAEFAELLDSYEATCFAYDAGGRAVADATLRLLRTFPPYRLLPAPVVRVFAFSILDEHVCRAFRYPRPPRPVVALCRGLLRLRGRVVRLLPPRRRPVTVSDLSSLRTYPNGYRVEDLGTFPSRT
ncbi:oxygenase MpaB family protein [Xylanimonas sp. McL0601]|uniref:oxygenase MpaB family protein n=1 Tax=Xylanimonas sp. McL0601 TaxID=3414739 RepID=UPI003CF958ED